MNLINELRAKSASAENTKSEVIAEIKTYFDKYLNSDALENYLKQTIGEREIRERKTFLNVKFWEYHSGCSTTHFSCAGKVWCNPENRDGWESHRYKGVELSTIDKEVCDYLANRLHQRMNELGFYFVSKENCSGRLSYYNNNFYFGW